MLDKYPKTAFVLIMLVMYGIGDLLLSRYYFPDVKGLHNSFYHHGLKSNYTGTMYWGDKGYLVHTNSLGFKDAKERDIQLKSDRYRILIIGDSFAEGAGLVYEDSFAGMLAEYFQKQDIEVLNAGTVSYSPKLYYLRLYDLIHNQGLEFDELFVFIDISDISNELDYMNWHPVPEDRVRKTDSYLRSISITYKTLRDTVLHRAIFSDISNYFTQEKVNKGVKRMEITTRPQDADAVNKAPAKNFQGLPRDTKTLRHERPRWTFDESVFNRWGWKGLELAEEHMRKVVELARKNNIKMSIAVYPWPEQIENGDKDSMQVRVWKAFAEKNNIGFINYFPEYFQQPAAQTIDKLFIKGDVHWNRAGHRIIADKLIAYWREIHEIGK